MISLSQRPLPDNTQHSQQTHICALGRIRTHNPSRQPIADLHLRRRSHLDWQSCSYGHLKIFVRSFGLPFERDSGLTPSVLCVRHLRSTGFCGLDVFHVEDQLTNVSCHCKHLTICGLSEKLSSTMELYDRKFSCNTDEHLQV